MGIARILVTGSSTGLGLLAARVLAGRGHDVTLHARDGRRADDVRPDRLVPMRPGWPTAPTWRPG